jgi:outer membrane lipoprotein-sorting protein
MMRKVCGFVVGGVIAGLVLLSAVSAAQIGSADALVRSMHDRYAKSWYQTLTFTQKSTTYHDDGTTKVETWYEAALLPGKLRIDIGPAADGRAYLLADGNVTVFDKGKEVNSRPLVNMLLVLGFDVYRQPPEKTLQVIASEKYDLSKFHEDSFEGRPMYVVGAAKGDLKSRQFWVDKERLLFVRLFQPDRTDENRIEDIRFTDYHEVAGGWVAARVEVRAADKLVFSEDYSDIKVNPTLDAALFDPKQFKAERRP